MPNKSLITKQPKSDSPEFLLGVLVGIGATAMVAVTIWMTDIKPRYTGAIEDIGAMAIENSRNLMACTSAYIASHEGQLPAGTKTKGEGNGLVVVGFQEK